MKKCFNCDKEFDESVDFCPTCGAKLGSDAAAEPETEAYQPKASASPQPVAAPVSAKNSEPVTVGEWMILLVNLIPCVGPLVYFIIMLVWAFSSDIKVSKKTFAKANLILWLISLGLTVIAFLILLFIGMGLPSIVNLLEDIRY